MKREGITLLASLVKQDVLNNRQINYSALQIFFPNVTIGDLWY